MSFKPKKTGGSGGTGPREDFKMPVPEDGNQPARISLIVDLGTQEREDFVDPNTKETKPQAPVQQLAIYADLVDNIVDYGGSIGEQPYRLALHKSFKGELSGVNFNASPPRDAEGNLIQGKIWTFHPANLLTKLAKATGNTQILGENEDDNMDIEQLLGESLFIDVQVKQNTSDKLDKDGEKIVYTNVNAKTFATVPRVKGKPMPVEDLAMEPLLITFDNVTPETVKFLRADVRRKIKLATDYVGSKMQKVLEEYEATLGTGETKGKSEDKPKEKPKAKAEPKAKAKAKKEDSEEEDFDDDIPW